MHHNGLNRVTPFFIFPTTCKLARNSHKISQKGINNLNFQKTPGCDLARANHHHHRDCHRPNHQFPPTSLWQSVSPEHIEEIKEPTLPQSCATSAQCDLICTENSHLSCATLLLTNSQRIQNQQYPPRPFSLDLFTLFVCYLEPPFSHCLSHVPLLLSHFHPCLFSQNPHSAFRGLYLVTLATWTLWEPSYFALWQSLESNFNSTAARNISSQKAHSLMRCEGSRRAICILSQQLQLDSAVRRKLKAKLCQLLRKWSARQHLAWPPLCSTQFYARTHVKKKKLMVHMAHFLLPL